MRAPPADDMTGLSVQPSLDSQWPMVGRQATMQRLADALERPAAIDLIGIYGTAGSGKTRLIGELVDRLMAAGRTVDKLTARDALSGIPGAAVAPLFGGDSPDTATHDAVELFRRARRLVTDRAGSGKLVLVIDGLTSLDPVSAQLIAQLVAAQAVLLVATLRDGETVPEAMSDLTHPERSIRVELNPLSIDETDVLLQTVLRGTVAHQAIHLLYRATRGNPFYLRELTIAAVTAGNLQLTAGVWQLVGEIPAVPALRELVLARLRVLDGAARNALERIALTEPIPVDELVAAEDTLEELEQRGLIVSDDADGRLTVSIAHPLYGNALRAGISRLRAKSVLLEQANILRAHEPQKGDQLRLARWLISAGAPVEADMVRSVARLALAAGQYASVVRLTDAVPEQEADAALLATRAEALRRLARLDEALAALERAIELDRQAPPDRQLGASLVSLLALTHADGVSGITRGLGILDRQSQQVSGDLKSILSARWFLLYYAERVYEALEVLDELKPPANASPAEQARHDMAQTMPLISSGRTAEGLAAAQRAIAFTTSKSADPMVVRDHSAQLLLALAEFQSGHFDLAARPAELALRLATAAEDEYVARYASFLLGRVEMESGRYVSAERWFREVAGVAATRGPISFRVPALAGLTLSLAATERLVEAEEFAAELRAPGGDRDFLVVEAVAQLDASAGHRDEAVERVLARAASAERGGHLFFAGSLLECVRRLGRPDLVEDALNRLATATDSDYLHGLASRKLMAVREYVARDDGSEGLDTSGLPAFGRPATTDQRSTGPDPLTRREREIAVLARQGLSSNQIAERLVVSVRTVNNHLQAVYSKLGIRGRRELPDLE